MEPGGTVIVTNPISTVAIRLGKYRVLMVLSGTHGRDTNADLNGLK